MQVLNGTGSFTFREIHVLDHPEGRVILFEIPAAPPGMPIAWKGHYYGRAGESLFALGQDKVDEIRSPWRRTGRRRLFLVPPSPISTNAP